MSSDNKLHCAVCDVEMNYHAVKIDYTQAAGEVASGECNDGGILKEFHSCPSCGTTAERRAEVTQ